MEPPVKRLRILRSVEVDETNPDYIAAKQKQEEKFKGRLEKLFTKYGDMHESMSDEIDFNTGKVVVDRGHLRRVQRQMKRKGPGLLDSLLASELQGEDSPEDQEEGGQTESEDELAPTQTRKRKRDSVNDREDIAQRSERDYSTLTTAPRQAVSIVTAPTVALQVPSTPNPAANLFQQIQQTPLDQQAQAALFANLNQTIAQAVQQAVAPFISILQNTPNGQAARSLFPAPSPHLPADDVVRPAADPKWYFPPLSATKDVKPSVTHRSSPPVQNEVRTQPKYGNEISSPIVARRSSPQVRVQIRHGTAGIKQSPRVPEASVERPHSSHSLPTLCPSNNISEGNPSDDGTPSSQVRRVRWLPKYHFTDEDNEYISKRRAFYNMSFKAIRDSKAQWSQWPLSAFYKHWAKCLKGKNLHLRDETRTISTARHAVETSNEHEEHFYSSIEIPETSSAEHRLPTPSSSEQEESHTERAAVPSSSHFNDDELELLSLSGADLSDVQSQHSSQYVDDAYPTPDEPVRSIEGEEFPDLRDENDFQRELQDELQDELEDELKVEDSPTPAVVQPKLLPSTIPETQESILNVSTPSQKRPPDALPKSKSKPKPAPISRADSDDLDLIGSDDELTASHVYIKQEPLSPQLTRALCSSPALKTPWTAPRSSGLVARSTGKLERSVSNKEIKQSWTNAKGKRNSAQKRRSLNILMSVKSIPRSAAVDLEGSDDELAP